MVAPEVAQTCLHVERTMSTWETNWLGGVSDAESVGSDEFRERRRRNSM